MENHSRVMIRDENLSILFNGGKTKSRQIKTLGGRKALAEIIPNVKNKQGTVSQDLSSCKPVFPLENKKNVSKVRKPLCDISNSSDPPVQLVKKIQQKIQNPRPHVDTIGEEKFLHKHEECVKSRGDGLDLGVFMKTIGLEKVERDQFDAGLQAESLLKNLELEEIDESEMLEEFATLVEAQRLTPPRSPVLHVNYWDDHVLPSFSLIESPIILKK